jgi:hypothetical protein
MGMPLNLCTGGFLRFAQRRLRRLEIGIGSYPTSCLPQHSRGNRCPTRPRFTAVDVTRITTARSLCYNIGRPADCVTCSTDHEESAFTRAKCTPPGGSTLINVKTESNSAVCDILELCGRRTGLDAARTAPKLTAQWGAAKRSGAAHSARMRDLPQRWVELRNIAAQSHPYRHPIIELSLREETGRLESLALGATFQTLFPRAQPGETLPWHLERSFFIAIERQPKPAGRS